MNELTHTTVRTPIGSLHLITDDQVLIASGFSSIPALTKRLSSQDQRRELRASRGLQWLTDLVEDYFDGDINAFDGSDLKVRQAGSDFSQRAWRAMRKIRTGKVISYAELAAKIGSPSAVRAAGSACGRNAIALMIPCHRIIRSDGTLGNYGYGLDKKSWLLRHEGAIE